MSDNYQTLGRSHIKKNLRILLNVSKLGLYHLCCKMSNFRLLDILHRSLMGEVTLTGPEKPGGTGVDGPPRAPLIPFSGWDRGGDLIYNESGPF